MKRRTFLSRVRTFLLRALTWTTVAYALAIGVAFWAMAAGDPKNIEFLAQTTLRANHRLVDGDIAEAGAPHRFFVASLATRNDFVGRYAAARVDKDHPIGLEQTRTGPNVTPKAGEAIVWISLSDWPAADVAALDVEQTVHVCKGLGAQTCRGPYAVQAIACATKDSTPAACSAAVAMTSDDRRLLTPADKNHPLSLIRLSDPAKPPPRRAGGRRAVRT